MKMAQQEIRDALNLVEESIKQIKELTEKGVILKDISEREIKHRNIIVEALNKQLITPPVDKVHPDYPYFGKNEYCICGVMFCDLSKFATNYCGNCGQKLRKTKEDM